MKSLSALAIAGLLAGCHSAYIAATISNHTAEPLSLIELDYPSASFGVQTLTPGQDYHYRFKVIGDGPTTILWTAAEHDHKNSGPTVREGDDGKLTITFVNPDANPTWNLQLTNRKSGS